MAFEKAFQNTYDDLPLHTKYRFAEIEIAQAARQLSSLYLNTLNPREYAINTLYDAITPKYSKLNDYTDEFFQVMNSTNTNQPPKQQQIHYLIVHGQTYKKIRELTKASFNTIAAARYGDPHYYPMFQHWNEEMLLTWNLVARSINVWNESLVHFKDN